MLEFAWPLCLLAAPLPWIFRALLPESAELRGARLRVPSHFLAGNASAVDQRPRRNWMNIVVWSLLVVAAMRPQWVGAPVETQVQGRDLLLAVDLSRSMGERDFNMNGQPVSRLALVKAVASDFIGRRDGDRVGLILFGAQAYLQTPLTFDRATVAAMLDEAQIGLAGNETAIGDAMGLAVKRLRESSAEKVLVLLTDGANTAGRLEPPEATALARAVEMRVHTIGLGSETSEAATLPGTAGGDRNDQFRRSVEQRTSLSMALNNWVKNLNEGVLRQIATATGGQYFRATNRESLEKIYAALDTIEPAKIDVRRHRPTDELFRWPLLVALVLSVLYALRGGGSAPRAEPA